MQTEGPPNRQGRGFRPGFQPKLPLAGIPGIPAQRDAQGGGRRHEKQQQRHHIGRQDGQQ